jgi:hypothetical protein
MKHFALCIVFLFAATLSAQTAATPAKPADTKAAVVPAPKISEELQHQYFKARTRVAELSLALNEAKEAQLKVGRDIFRTCGTLAVFNSDGDLVCPSGAAAAEPAIKASTDKLTPEQAQKIETEGNQNKTQAKNYAAEAQEAAVKREQKLDAALKAADAKASAAKQ